MPNKICGGFDFEGQPAIALEDYYVGAYWDKVSSGSFASSFRVEDREVSQSFEIMDEQQILTYSIIFFFLPSSGIDF